MACTSFETIPKNQRRHNKQHNQPPNQSRKTFKLTFPRQTLHIWNGLCSLTSSLDTTAKQAWEVYKHSPAFLAEGVVFSQFKEHLRDHRKQMGKKAYISQKQLEALIHDRKLYPRAPHNHKGEPVFDASNATSKGCCRQETQDNETFSATKIMS